MRQKPELSTKTKADQLEWRRSKVIEIRSRDLNHTEIAHKLVML
jgi:hypothetical protein